jgi:tetratricopeptide (TPR) repeat protein
VRKTGKVNRPEPDDDRVDQMTSVLGDMFRQFLDESGLTKERDQWDRLMKEAADRKGLTKGSAATERTRAWRRFTQGDRQGAVDQLESLLERLRATTAFDPSFDLALTTTMLGRVLTQTKGSAQGIQALRDALGQWEALAETAEGRPWEELLTSPAPETPSVALVNLAATMGDLANALSDAGHYDEALALGEKSLLIHALYEDRHQVATGHGICASILLAAGRYGEADARFDLALAAAREAQDKTLEGDLLLHQGLVAVERDQLERVGLLYRQALALYEEAGEHQGMMRAYNLLGLDDRKAGRLAEARAWYEKAHEFAGRLNDQAGLANAAQNISALRQMEGENARVLGDEPAALRHFEEARRSMEESLRIKGAFPTPG